MRQRILCFALALLVGAALAGGKYLLTRRLDRLPPNGFLLASLIRQGVNLLALVATGLLGWYLELPMLPLLAGMALGLTVPTVIIAVSARKTRSKEP